MSLSIDLESLFGLCVRANFDKPRLARDGGLPLLPRCFRPGQ